MRTEYGLTEAVAALSRAWPEASFFIDCEVWSQCSRRRRAVPRVEWSIYNVVTRQVHRHPDLHGCVDLALGGSSLDRAQAQLDGASPLVPCGVCAEPRTAGILHYCTEAFARQEARLLGGQR